VGEPDRAPRCSVSVYDPSHLAGQIMIRSMSLFGTSRHFAVLWNLIAIGAPRTLASRSPGRFMGSRPREFSLHVRLRGFHWIHPGREQRALFGFYFEPPRANGSASSSLRSSEINYFALIATMASPIASRIIAAAKASWMLIPRPLALARGLTSFRRGLRPVRRRPVIARGWPAIRSSRVRRDRDNQ
jgi:hypothetical protein